MPASRCCAAGSWAGRSRRSRSSRARHDRDPPQRDRGRDRARADRNAARALVRDRELGPRATGAVARATDRIPAAIPSARRPAIPGQLRGDAVSPVHRLRDRRRSRHHHRDRGGRQPRSRGCGDAVGAGAGAGAEGRALSRVRADARLRAFFQDRTGRRRRAVSDSARDLSGRECGRAKARLVGTRRWRLAAALPVHGGVARRTAGDHDRLPHRPRDLMHRGVPGRDDHLDRGPREHAGAGRPQLSDRRHVRADHRDLAARARPQCRLQRPARPAFAGLSGRVLIFQKLRGVRFRTVRRCEMPH